MSIFVTGATSQIGQFLLPKFLRTGQKIVALSRCDRAISAHGVRWLIGQLPDDVPDTGPLSAIVSFGPLDGLAQWLAHYKPAGEMRLVATSSMSAESKRDSHVDGERLISHRLREGEQMLIAQCERLGIGWTILRPTLIYGAGLDMSLTPIARRAMRWRVFPLPMASGLRQPVHAEDVAMAAILALEAPQAAGRTIALGGGERLSVAEMFRRVRNSLPGATVPLALPGSALMRAARIQPYFRGPLLRLETDLVADNHDAQALLGIEPRSFRPTAATWGLGR